VSADPRSASGPVDAVTPNPQDAPSRNASRAPYSRDLFKERFESLVAVCRIQGSSVWVALLEVDHLKSVSDEYGQAVVEAVGINAARRLSELLPSTAVVARLSVDEIAVLLLDVTDLVEAARIAETMRVAIGRPMEHRHVGADVTVTVSTGLTLTHRDDQFRDVIFRASNALNDAQNDGGDCVAAVAP